MTSAGLRLSGQELIDFLRHPDQLRNLPLHRWDALLRVARRTNLVGRLAIGVRKLELHANLPDAVLKHIESAEILTTHQRAAIEWETRHIAEAFTGFDQPVVLLKGAAYACSGLVAAEGRLFGDVDILVPRESMNAAEAALMLKGWTTGQNDPYDERYYRQWMHEIPPMTHRGRGTVIDLHHNILPLTTKSSPDPELLIEASEPLADSRFRVLCPIDMVIHSATHLFYESELQNGLRDLFDLDALLVEFSARSAGFWDELAERAVRLGLALPVSLALRNTLAVLGTQSPTAVRAALEKAAGQGGLFLSGLDAVYRQALMPDHPLSTNATAVLARFFVYLRGHYLRMPPSLLAVHLGRKAVVRLFRNTSRSA
jgi:hypothetical protein